MTISTGSVLQGLYGQLQVGGRKLINSDFSLEIEGYDSSWLLVKEFPWPELSTGGEIEVPGPLGLAYWEFQQAKVHQQGAITLLENEQGQVDEMLIKMLANGGRVNAKVYQGTPQNYLFYKPIYDMGIQLDNPDRDWDNRSQILTFTGTAFFHYFGEKVMGTAK